MESGQTVSLEPVPGQPTASNPPIKRTRKFFLRGLKTLLPTLITLSLIIWLWDFLWEQLGRHVIWVIQNAQYQLEGSQANWESIKTYWMYRNDQNEWVWNWWAQLLGVSLSLLLVYMVGLLVGNLIGKTFYIMVESLVLRIPIVRAIYPSVKQVTDFVLQEKSAHFQSSRVVACKPHSNDIWSIGLITGDGIQSLAEQSQSELVTVFIPSSPTAFTGYVVIVPKMNVIELPLKVEDVMRMLISGGVLNPQNPLSNNPKTPR